MYSVDEAADDERVVVRMRDVRHVGRAAEDVSLRARHRIVNALENGMKERRALIAFRDQHRPAELRQPVEIERVRLLLLHFVEPRRRIEDEGALHGWWAQLPPAMQRTFVFNAP